MRVYKDTPFELSMMPWELRPPRTTLMLVVKATFAYGGDGPCTLAPEQVPCLGPVAWDDGEEPSLKYESDYAILKPRGEWYLTGHAYAGGPPAKVVPVRVRIGSLWKEMVVFGDREWRLGVMGRTPSDPVPFERMPLRWERSLGGPGVPTNPVGAGRRPVQTANGTAHPLPNIEDPRQLVATHGDRPHPVGMFAVPGAWPPRRDLTGTYDEGWVRSRWPFLPTDFDFRFFNCAPPDQQIPEGYWRGDEPVVLHGLHPARPIVHTQLPGLRPRLFVERVTARPPDAPPLEMLSRAELEALGPPVLEDVHLRLDTITVDSDLGVLMCQWRGHVEVVDAQYSDLARIFLLHEPLDTVKTVDAYRAWALGELLDEADEFDPPEMPEEEPAALTDGDEQLDGDESGDDVELPDDVPDDDVLEGEVVDADPGDESEGPATEPPPRSPEEELEHRLLDFNAKMFALFEATDEELLEKPPEVPMADVRREFIEKGADPERVEELFVDAPEVPPVVEIDDEPPSYRRLAAIIRRKLGHPFQGLDLSGAPFARLDLSGVDFSESILTDACFDGANLAGCVMDGALLARASMVEAFAREASFVGADLSEVRAARTNFDGARFDAAMGTGGDYQEARFEKASFVGAELEDSNFTRAHLRGCVMDAADFVGSTLVEADLTGSSLVDTSLESVKAMRARFERCKMPDLRASDGADLSGAYLVLVDAPRAQLQGTKLTEANLSGSNLQEADLSDSVGERVNLMRCVLRSAKLDRARLPGAVLIQADLFEASLQEADLSAADARGAHLHTAALWRARLDGAILDGAVLDRTLLSRFGRGT